MYNRYIRQDDGSYTRVTEPEAPARGPGPPPPQGGAPPNTPPNKEQERPRPDGPQPSAPGGQLPFTFPPFSGGTEGIAGYLRRVLDQLHLDRVDAGDLLLLGLLYFLVREKADEELLVALGLLLIL